MSGVQYRIALSKTEERVSGPDDASVVVTVPAAVVKTSDFNATVEFMRGRLKSVGPTGPLFAALSDGSAQRDLVRLASDL
jgi:hypothetical protein